MDKLIDPLYIGLHIVNLAVLVFVLKLLVYKPMKKFMDKRRAAVQGELSQAQNALSSAQALTDAATQKELQLNTQTKADCFKQLQDAHAKAEGIISAADKEAALIIDQARTQAKNELEAAKEQQKQIAAELAVDVAAAVLSRSLTQQEQQALLEQSMAEAEKHEL